MEIKNIELCSTSTENNSSTTSTNNTNIINASLLSDIKDTNNFLLEQALKSSPTAPIGNLNDDPSTANLEDQMNFLNLLSILAMAIKNNQTNSTLYQDTLSQLQQIANSQSHI